MLPPGPPVWTVCSGEMNADGLRIDSSMYSPAETSGIRSPAHAAASASDANATSEVLDVISRSPTHLQPVFDIIAESAVRLCKAEVATVTRFDGEWVHIDAIHGSSAVGVKALCRTFPMRPGGAGGAARAIRDRAIVHIGGRSPTLASCQRNGRRSRAHAIRAPHP